MTIVLFVYCCRLSAVVVPMAKSGTPAVMVFPAKKLSAALGLKNMIPSYSSVNLWFHPIVSYTTTSSGAFPAAFSTSGSRSSLRLPQKKISDSADAPSISAAARAPASGAVHTIASSPSKAAAASRVLPSRQATDHSRGTIGSNCRMAATPLLLVNTAVILHADNAFTLSFSTAVFRGFTCTKGRTVMLIPCPAALLISAAGIGRVASMFFSVLINCLYSCVSVVL